MKLPRKKSSAAPPARAFDMMLTGVEAPNLAPVMAQVTAAYGRMQQSVERIAGDRTLNDAARLVRQASAAKSIMGPALDNLAAARSQTAAGRTATLAALQKHYDYSDANLAQISLATETRGYFRSLPDKDRLDVVQKAITDFDLQTLRALSGAPAALSGVHPTIHELCREKLLQLVAPDELARSKQLTAEIDFAANFEDQLRQAVADSVDFATAADIEKAAAE